jgi:hypothetical protein
MSAPPDRRRGFALPQPADRPGLGIGSAFQSALDRSDPAHLLLQLLLGVPVGLEDRLGRLAQVMEVAQLVSGIGQRGSDRPPDRMLPVRDHAADRDRQGGPDLAQQRGQVGPRRAQEAAGQQHLAGQALADDPEHLVAHVRLQAVDGQDRPPLREEPLAQAGVVTQAQGHQLLVPLEQVRHRPLGDRHAAIPEGPMDLRHAAELGVPQGAH